MKLSIKFSLVCIMSLFLLLSGPVFSLDEYPHFPPSLTNKGRKKGVKPDIPIKKSRIIFKYRGKRLSGILVNPADAKNKKKYPGVLLIQTIDETPEQWTDRMADLAGKGYVVMVIKYKDKVDVEQALNNLMILEFVDKSKIGILGVHEGATQAILLAIERKKDVKCVVSISGRPPYDIEGGKPAEKLLIPLLLIHGEIDSQVPPSVSQYFFYALKELNKPAEIYILGGVRHFLNDMEWCQAQARFVKFFDNRLKGKMDEAPEEKVEKE